MQSTKTQKTRCLTNEEFDKLVDIQLENSFNIIRKSKHIYQEALSYLNDEEKEFIESFNTWLWKKICSEVDEVKENMNFAKGYAPKNNYFLANFKAITPIIFKEFITEPISKINSTAWREEQMNEYLFKTYHFLQYLLPILNEYYLDFRKELFKEDLAEKIGYTSGPSKNRWKKIYKTTIRDLLKQMAKFKTVCKKRKMHEEKEIKFKEKQEARQEMLKNATEMRNQGTSRKDISTELNISLPRLNRLITEKGYYTNE